MAKITSISRNDRALEKVLSRDEATATTELRECLASFSSCLVSLAQAHPGTVAIGFFVAGQAFRPMVLAGSGAGDVCHESALNAMRGLAQVVGRMSPELLAGFQLELNLLLEKDRLLAEMEKVVSAALAADKETGRA